MEKALNEEPAKSTVKMDVHHQYSQVITGYMYQLSYFLLIGLTNGKADPVAPQISII
jgi:hypothetical protein